MNNVVIKNARFIVTSNEVNEILENATLVIEDGKIIEINPAQIPEGEVFDAQHHLVMPGLVNAHTHLAMVLLRGWAEGVNLDGFLTKVWAAEGAIMDKQTCALGTELGAGEALLSGTTTALDMYLHPDATHEAAVKVGLRHICGPIFFDFPGLDGLEWSQRIDFAEQWPTMLRSIGGAQIPLFYMPHSVYTDSEPHLREVAELAKVHNARINLHVSETQVENQMSAQTHKRTPTEVIRDVGILDQPTTYGHGVHLSESDIAITAKYGAGIGHCPGSNLKLGSGIADIRKYQEAGIKVGLGTDGCSSSNDLDMWSVMRLAAHMVALKHSPADVDLVSIIRAATIEGAHAVGMGDQIGSIEIGKEADLIAVDLRSLHLSPVHDVLALLVFAAGRSDVTDVWVSGQQVVKGGHLTQIDEDDLISRVNERVKALAELPR